MLKRSVYRNFSLNIIKLTAPPSPPYLISILEEVGKIGIPLNHLRKFDKFQEQDAEGGFF